MLQLVIMCHIHVHLSDIVRTGRSRAACRAARGRALPALRQGPIVREFRDVVFEDVVLDNNSSVAPY